MHGFFSSPCRLHVELVSPCFFGPSRLTLREAAPVAPFTPQLKMLSAADIRQSGRDAALVFLVAAVYGSFTIFQVATALMGVLYLEPDWVPLTSRVRELSSTQWLYTSLVALVCFGFSWALLRAWRLRKLSARAGVGSVSTDYQLYQWDWDDMCKDCAEHCLLSLGRGAVRLGLTSAVLLVTAAAASALCMVDSSMQDHCFPVVKGAAVSTVFATQLVALGVYLQTEVAHWATLLKQPVCNQTRHLPATHP